VECSRVFSLLRPAGIREQHGDMVQSWLERKWMSAFSLANKAWCADVLGDATQRRGVRRDQLQCATR